ncbi:hypothetical protein K466DRAFT_214828 [Polyporus arcularius HHB13444]|uniref:Uncharacterized protein n=1 Tax=Polyporus arcularius HHB13444 TaxID=1314778 RepID=A0A5C3P6Y8_9APHY|nr:hypothetical protein K466DRAFT_214828 [Polyporus arcularius HHB13444]
MTAHTARPSDLEALKTRPLVHPWVFARACVSQAEGGHAHRRRQLMPYVSPPHRGYPCLRTSPPLPSLRHSRPPFARDVRIYAPLGSLSPRNIFARLLPVEAHIDDHRPRTRARVHHLRILSYCVVGAGVLVVPTSSTAPPHCYLCMLSCSLFGLHMNERHERQSVSVSGRESDNHSREQSHKNVL